MVVRLVEGTIMGYLTEPELNTNGSLKETVGQDTAANWNMLRIRVHPSQEVVEIARDQVQAMFFIHSFTGDAAHHKLRFHAYTPATNGIWMRVTFGHGEVMEGFVMNSLRYLVDDGFFLQPTDPDGNNKLVYIMKSSLIDHQILGLRKI